MNKKIEDLSEIELKALAFEHSLQVEHSQGAIVTIKTELLKRQQEASVAAPAAPTEGSPSKLTKAK